MVEIIGRAPSLTPMQRKFNQLIARLNQQREELARWRVFHQTYQDQLADRYRPAMARLREMRIAMVQLLDRHLDGRSLRKRERIKVRDMLGPLLAQLLEEVQDPELLRLYEKYAGRSFEDELEERREDIRELVSEALGIDAAPYDGDVSPEQLARWIESQAPKDSADAGRRPSKLNAKARAREALRVQAAEGASRAVREVFRKLVSELHPDREADPIEQARKTELMQRVNRAYKAQDLLVLLELQLSIEQIDPADLAGLADERLRHYVHVLEEQSRRLRDELDDIVNPFSMAIGVSPGRKLSPASVQQVLDVEIQEIRAMLRGLDADLKLFQDVDALKRSLREYRVDPQR